MSANLGIYAVAGVKFMICPFEFSLDLALWVDCIICDVNYVFDPRVYLKRFFLERSIDCTFLVDEAHNLVDRSREMFSAAIKKSDFLKDYFLLFNKKVLYDDFCSRDPLPFFAFGLDALIKMIKQRTLHPSVHDSLEGIWE